MTSSRKSSFYQRIGKRAFDLSFSLLLLVFLSPLFFLLIILSALGNKGKVFFIQYRPGKKEALFPFIKFKTMNDERDRAGQFLPDEDRLTAVGAFLRRSSLDELPQLLNVVKGDMSFVGPRPWLKEYLPLYSETQRYRHLVKPGITGWAQIHGRNAMAWSDRFEYDLFYVRHCSFGLDAKIVWKTLIYFVSGRFLNKTETKSIEKFKAE